MTTTAAIEEILKMITEYNRRQYEYGKEYRNYGTDHLLRHDQVHLIDHIGQNPNCNLRFLADTVGLGLPTVSLQIKKLEQVGLVYKRRSTINLRELELNLTEMGQKVFNYHNALDEDFYKTITEKLLARYSEEDIKLIMDFVTHILMKH